MIKFLLISLLSILTLTFSQAQRFSFIIEGGLMKTQADGDRIQGFRYNGYTVGIGSNYAFNSEHFISVKTSYFDQGSRGKDNYVLKPIEIFQMELDYQTVGLELSYKYKPFEKKYYIGISAVRHQIIGFDYNLIDTSKEEFDRNLNTEKIRGAFNSIKLYYGYEIFDKASIYLSTQVSITNLMKSNFYVIETLVPYSIDLVFAYEIFATKEEKFKQRPGSKSRKSRVVRGMK